MKQRMQFTEAEHINLVKTGNRFWTAFSKLIAECVADMPEELEGEVLAYLQDKASVYGSKYDDYLPAARAKRKAKTKG